MGAGSGAEAGAEMDSVTIGELLAAPLLRPEAPLPAFVLGGKEEVTGVGAGVGAGVGTGRTTSEGVGALVWINERVQGWVLERSEIERDHPVWYFVGLESIGPHQSTAPCSHHRRS